MQDKRYIICGNAPTSGIEENPDRDLRLRLWGKDGPDKITLRIEDIHKKMSKDVPDSFQDLLEIATYVYSADQAIPRGADAEKSAFHHSGPGPGFLERQGDSAGPVLDAWVPV